MAKSLNLNSAYDYIFRSLSMIAYMIEIQNTKFANINSVNEKYEPGHLITFRVYFYAVGYLPHYCHNT